MYSRIFNIPASLSFLLFGARGTGKSTLLRKCFSPDSCFWLDLLDVNVEGHFARDPSRLERELDAVAGDERIRWVVIDEVQKIPELLSTVHRLIEKKRFRFALSGSSARKLKRGGADLLAGRAVENFLFPLTHRELGESFDLDFVLRWGSLPQVFALEEKERNDYLRTYVNTYLREEIQAEQLVRKMAPFRSFLEIAAQSSGQIISYSKIARDIGSDPVSVQNYFEILKDTHIAFELPPFHESVRKRQRKNPKIFLFDLGVATALRQELSLPVIPGNWAYGNAFEAFIIAEIHRLNHYFRRDWRLSYLRTKDDVEIDLIVERPGVKRALIEIKATDQIQKDDIRGLISVGRDIANAELFCLSRDSRSQIMEGVACLPWQKGFLEIGLGPQSVM